jgi:hypothetical protein
MTTPGPDALPALFRAGDIGVSSEWRDITYDWAPVLTADGVFIYSYLRDMFDNQRMLRPFILDPDGPTKQRIQRILGRRTGWAIQGPEYLLATVGLVHVEVQYGSSSDVERPHYTAATYYVVGRLDHPVLDWPMLGRVLDALMVALEPSASDPTYATRQKDAQAALRSLGQAGMLQNIDPEDLFDPDGAWPSLLPTLIQDERWTKLFVQLHGVAALQPYRQQARAWVEWAQRRATRLMQENRAIANQLLAAQRRGPRGGGHNGTPGMPPAHSPFSQMNNAPETYGMGTHASGSVGAVPEKRLFMGTNARVPEGREVNHGPEPVSGESPMSPQGLAVTQRPVETNAYKSWQQPVPEAQSVAKDESLQRDQISLHVGSHENLIHHSGQPSVPQADEQGDIPLVAAYLRDDELSSTRHDSHFWQAVQQILHGDQQRYAYTEGEKKAAYRLFKRTETPIGVVLAALRAVMSLPQPQQPGKLGDAFKMPVFHRCVQQALALVQSRPETSATWNQFLHTYRSIGQRNSLRDVSVPEYHVLKSLFERQPDECWEVLQRAEQAAQPPQLSVAYLRRAISNNQQAAAARSLQSAERKPRCRVPGKSESRRVPAEQAAHGLVPDVHDQPIQGHDPAGHADPVPAAASDGISPIDSRRVLLEREGVNPAILSASITEQHIYAWIAEADARQAEIKDRAAWLAWGVRSGHLPKDHPKLPPAPQRGVTTGRSGLSPGVCVCGRYTGGGACGQCGTETGASGHSNPGSATASDRVRQLWPVALDHLRRQLPSIEFETWIKETSLIQVEDQQAIVGTPNIFVRDKLSDSYAPLIAEALHTILGFSVQVVVVLDAKPAYYR